jgi:hypothetical protein
MKRTLTVILLTLSTLACGPSEEEVKEKEQRRVRLQQARQAIAKVTEESDRMLKRLRRIHQRFLEVRNEKDPETTLPALGEAMVFPETGRSGNTCLVIHIDNPAVRKKKGEFEFLNHWDPGSGARPGIASMDGAVKFLARKVKRSQIHADGVEKEFDIKRTRANGFRYLVMIDGGFVYARVGPRIKERVSFIPGVFEGVCYVFRVEDEKYLCRFPVTATNSPTFDTTAQDIPRYLKVMLHLEVKSKTRDVLSKAFGQ